MIFLPPRGVKIRAEWQSVSLPDEPSLLSPRDDERIVLILYVGISSDEYPVIARTRNGINVNAGITAFDKSLEIYGPEEIWVAQAGAGPVFVAAAWTYQALYWA